MTIARHIIILCNYYYFNEVLANKMNKYNITPDGKVKISINIPFNTLKRLDEIRKKEKKTRSNWITQTVLEKLASQPKLEEEEIKQ